MRFDFFNDTGREVRIHPATFEGRCEVNAEKIQPLEIRSFTLPPDTYPVLKLWGHGDFMMIYVWETFGSITKFFDLQEF
ncbi:hypothetical protein J14TS5_50020 [Paenibacillus lautus]|uniref:hypothetical protein n=1 Tax=Paenibacillus lautus TaxID=1401 RepID=UPI001AFCFDCE|nr:hypothetical protein [Paenibacillus lautus]GIO99916.1 hypothetical protein J14TS5_50020 [Paenibacillus lautus]